MFEINKRSSKIFAIVFIVLMIAPYVAISKIDSSDPNFLKGDQQIKNASATPSLVWDFIKGLAGTGASITPRLEQLESATNYLVVPTDLGISVIAQSGAIVSTFVTRAPVIDFDVISDINQDGWKEIVLVVLDNQNPNVICIDSKIGKAIWKFNPIIEGFDVPSVMPKNFTTRSWDLTKVKDINDDNIPDIIVSSWYRLYALSGKDGSVMWKKEEKSLFLDDIFRVVSVPQSSDFDRVVIGTELGGIFCLNSKTGQILWNSSIPRIELLIYEGSTAVTKGFPVSITDIYPKGENILVAANDGYLYLFDANGLKLSSIMIFNITKPKTPLMTFSSNGELYSYEKRIFQKGGMRILQEIDVSNNGTAEFLVYTSKLRYGYDNQDLVNIAFVSLSSNQLYLMNSKNYTDSYSGLSYPLARKAGAETRLYFVSSNSAGDIPGDLTNALFYLPVSQMGNISNTAVFLIPSSYGGYSQSFSTLSYQNVLCNAWDVNGVASLFYFNRNGQLALLNVQNSQSIWTLKAEAANSEVEVVQDINGDGINEILVSSEVEFVPEWKSMNSPIGNLESNRSINSLKLIYGNNGSIIWEYQNPSPIYQGLRDLLIINDIDGDGVNDIASWIVPQNIPSEIQRYVQSLKENIPNIQDPDTEYIYRALLANYTRVLVISGKTGDIIRNLPMFDMPYRFSRYTTHDNSYLNPTNQYVSNNGYLYHRSNIQADSTWGLFSGELNFPNNWAWSSLIHPSSLDVISGANPTGSFYDLYDIQSNTLKVPLNNYTITVTKGYTISPENRNIANSDYSRWDVVSQKDGSVERVILDIDYQPEILSYPLQLTAIEVSYTAILSKLVNNISLSAYAYNNFSYSIISDNTINTTNKAIKTFQIGDITNYRSSTNNTKLRLQISELESFNISIDQLMVNYVFSLQNYTIESQDTGSQNSVIFDTEYLLDFSNEKKMGSNDYILSQIERLSALKIQSLVSINQSSPSGFSYKYELWNYTSNSWVPCDWNDVDTYWNTVNGPFPKIKGGYSTIYRSSASDFSFGTDYRSDSIFVQVRGTKNYHAAIAFDYQNKTDLSHFVGVNNQIKIRTNVTSTAQTFKLSVDALGIQAFYWDVIQQEFDKLGIYNYPMGYFDKSLLKNLVIQGFLAVNGTGDSKLDVMAITSFEQSLYSSISNIYRLFDLGSSISYSIWSTNTSLIPNSYSKIEVINNSQAMNILLTGTFDSGKTKRVASVSLLSSQSYFQNLSNFEPLSFVWSINYTHPNSGTIILPSIVQVKKDGTIGLALAEFDEMGSRKNIQVIDINSLSVLSRISMQNLILRQGLYLYEINKPDRFTAYTKLSCLDMNGDGWLDHAVLYQTESKQSIRVISGNPSSIDTILSEYTYNELEPGRSFSEQITMTFSVENGGDLSGNGKDILIVSKEYDTSSGYNYGMAGSILIYLKENGETLSDWILNPISKPAWTNEQGIFSTYKVMKAIGDLNGDGFSEILVNRISQDRQIVYGIEQNLLYEIMDVRNKKMLYEFTIPIENIVSISTIEGNVSYFIASVGSMLIAVNNGFKVEFKGLSNNQQMQSSQFVVEWAPKIPGEFIYEFIVNGTSYGKTKNTNQRLSLSSGDKTFVIKMYDEEGLIIAMDSIEITIPQNQTMLIITIAMISAIVAVAVVFKVLKNKKMKQILVDERNVKMEDAKND